MLTRIRNQKSAIRNPRPLRLALIQHACSPDPRRNLGRATDMIRQAARQGARLIVTQELFTNRYFPQTEDARNFRFAEPIPGPTSNHLARLARRLRVSIVGSIFEKRAAGLYHNTAILIDPRGRIAAKYRKMHVPDDPRFYEKYYFAPGDLGWQTAAVPYARGRTVTAGLLICWDQWYPEAARLTALRGAEILLYPSAIGWHHRETAAARKQQREAWITMHRAHAIANGIFVAAVNRVGVEDELKFWGSSLVVDPGGAIIAQATGDKEEVVIADCDLRRITEIRHGWPFLRDRRVDGYEGLTQRYIDGAKG